MKRKMLLLTLAIPVILSQNVQAQTSSRLVAEANWANNGATFDPVDSSSYSYSGGRGGDLNHTMNYDNATTWTYDTSFHNSWYYIQTFDASNNITSRIAEYWDGSMWVLYSNTLFNYNSSNLMTSMILQSWNGSSWSPVSQNLYSYNTANRLVIDQFQNWNSLTSMFEPTSQKTYYYDGSGNKINETDQTFVLSVPVYTHQWAYTYSGTNQLLTTTYNTWNGSGWDPTTLYVNTYDTSGNMTNQLYQIYDMPNAAWVNNTLHLYSGFTGAHMPGMDVEQHWDATGGGSWVNYMEFMNTYNSFDQLTSRTGISWNIVGVFEFAAGDPMTNYYYGTYTPGTSTVKTISAAGGEASIYPVPVQNILHVDLTWDNAQAANIAIYDAQGRIAKQWSTPSGTTYNGTVALDNLSEGTYFIRITGTMGQIVKQLVVAH